MKLREIEFGNILGASGVQGFFGEGYKYHKPYELCLGLKLDGLTFVAKTATCERRKGNMALTNSYEPVDYFPDCIKVKPLSRLMLNAISLSNPGLEALILTGWWQKIDKPFWLSVMPVADTGAGRIDEAKALAEIIARYKDGFKLPFGIQVNLSCPNTEHNPCELINESARIIDEFAHLNVPIMPKFSIATAPIRAIMELNDTHCDAICVSNTLPFGWEKLDWQKVWGSKVSPLEKYGGGGLSGKILKPLVCEWIERLRQAGFKKPINGGGGIMSPADVLDYHLAGASSVFIGSVVALRPWQVKPIITQANSLIWR